MAFRNLPVRPRPRADEPYAWGGERWLAEHDPVEPPELFGDAAPHTEDSSTGQDGGEPAKEGEDQ